MLFHRIPGEKVSLVVQDWKEVFYSSHQGSTVDWVMAEQGLSFLAGEEQQDLSSLAGERQDLSSLAGEQQGLFS